MYNYGSSIPLKVVNVTNAPTSNESTPPGIRRKEFHRTEGASSNCRAAFLPNISRRSPCVPPFPGRWIPILRRLQKWTTFCLRRRRSVRPRPNRLSSRYLKKNSRERKDPATMFADGMQTFLALVVNLRIVHPIGSLLSPARVGAFFWTPG